MARTERAPGARGLRADEDKGVGHLEPGGDSRPHAEALRWAGFWPLGRTELKGWRRVRDKIRERASLGLKALIIFFENLNH